MIFGSIKTYQDMNVWERLSALPGLGLAGWQLIPWHHFLSWGRMILFQKHLIMQGCVLAAGTEMHGWVFQLQGVELSSEVESLKYWPENRPDRFASPLTFYWNTEQGTGGPGPGPVGTSTQRGVQIQGNISASLAAFLIWSGIRGLGDFRIHQACWEETRKLRAEDRGSLLLQPSSPGFYRRDAKKSQKLPHCVQDSPAPRRKRSHSRGAWSLWQHQEPKRAAGWGRSPGVSGVKCWPSCSLIGAFTYDVTALCLCRLPCPLGPLPGQKWALYALPALNSLWARGGCEGCTIPMSPVPTAYLVVLCQPLPDTQPGTLLAGNHQAISWQSPSPHQSPPLLTSTSLAAPGDHLPGHILRIQAHPHFPGQQGVCTGSMGPGTSGP